MAEAAPRLSGDRPGLDHISFGIEKTRRRPHLSVSRVEFARDDVSQASRTARRVSRAGTSDQFDAEILLTFWHYLAYTMEDLEIHGGIAFSMDFHGPQGEVLI